MQYVECGCHAEGSYSNSCDVDGKCLCKPLYTGDKCDQSRTKFIIAAGSRKRRTDIVDPLIDNYTCQDKIKPFPFTLFLPYGGIIGAKTPFICGGQKTMKDDYSLNPHCYTLDLDTREWKIDAKATLITPRYGAGSVILGTKLVIAGGAKVNGDFDTLQNSIEVLSPGQESRELDVTLPKAIQELCVVSWDEDTIFVIGGKDKRGFARAETYIINIKTLKIIDGPKLKIPRHSHACQELQIEGRNYVVVVGGYIFTRGLLKSTEVLDKGNLDQGWVSGDDLNRAGLKWFQMVGDGQGSLYAMGGYGAYGNGKSVIYKYQCNGDISTCVWIKSDAASPFRGSFVALPITNELAQNLCQ